MNQPAAASLITTVYDCILTLRFLFTDPHCAISDTFGKSNMASFSSRGCIQIYIETAIQHLLVVIYVGQ